jgi:hypothetical protein
MSKPILRHPNCKDADCATCLEDAEALMAFCAQETGNNKVDHLSRYRAFFEKTTGTCAETEWGWFIPEIFDAKNIDDYIQDFKAEDKPCPTR